MASEFYLLFSILVLLIVLALAAVYVKRKNKRPTDYYSLFILGVMWLAIGLPFQNYTLAGLGLAFMIAGLVHRKDWEKNRVRWSDLTPEERKLRLAITVALGVLVLLGLVAWYLADTGMLALP